eukprot:866184-Karenia_brevis.AAC.1
MLSFKQFQGPSKKRVFGNKRRQRPGPRGERGARRANNPNGRVVRQSLSMYAVSRKDNRHAHTN